MPTQLLTEWVNVARGGMTADKRNIEPAWLEEMAAAYDPSVYTAVVNVEHWYGNLGTVRELRTVKEGDQLYLQARIAPNKYYLARNSESTGIFFSVEITHDFAGTGKCYLTGLASTDTPASLGTSEVHFSKTSAGSTMTEPLKAEFSLGDTPPRTGGIAETIRNVFHELFPEKNEKENQMTENEFKTLLGAALAPLTEKLAALKPETPAGNEEFKTLKSDHDALRGEYNALKLAFDKLRGEFDEAVKEEKTAKPAPETGAAADEDLI